MRPDDAGMTDVTGPRDIEAGGILTIDLGAIVANLASLGARAAPAQCAAVVKADGYGCGVGEVAGALAQAGCATFFVANLTEARRARTAASDAAISVLTGVLPGTAQAYAEANLRPVIGSDAELDEWTAFRAASGWKACAALHIDSGMNRLGFPFAEASALAHRLPKHHGIALVMSHFACSEDDHPRNTIQIKRFAAVRAAFPGIAGSLANSSGIFLGPRAHHDLVPPGVALYGANPTPGRPNPMRPVVSLQGRIVQTRDVASGATVGYSATWTAKRATRLALGSGGCAGGLLPAARARG